MQRLLVVMLVGCAALALEGCTAVGAGVGSVFPKYDRVYPPYGATLKEGTPVRLTTEAEPEPVDGNYVGAHDGRLTLQTEGRDRTYPEGDISELRRRSGSHWLEGLLFGAVADVTIAVIVVLAVSAKSKPSTDPGTVRATLQAQ
jgi:hypothetical protein